MKNFLIMYLLPLHIILYSNIVAQQSEIRQVEKLIVDWQNSDKSYDIIIESTDDFERLRIKIPGRRDFTLVDSLGFFSIKEALFDSALIKRNLAKSKYIYMSHDLKSRQGYPALIVFGNPEASDPGSIHVIIIDSLGVPKEIFNSETYQLTDIKDLDNDGVAEIIGKHCLSQLWGIKYGEDCFSTYDPYSVYKMNTKGIGNFSYNMELSKQFNLDHYYGWAGKLCSEETIIVLCTKDGKPKLMKRKDAERIYK